MGKLCSQSRSSSVRSFMRRKSSIVLKSCRLIICAVGTAKVLSSSVGPNVLTIEGRLMPGNVEVRHSSSFSPTPIRAMQSGGASNKLRNEESRVMTFWGNNNPLGELPSQMRRKTFPDQKDKTTNDVVGECCSAREYAPDEELAETQ